MTEIKVENVELDKIVLLADNVNKMNDVTFNDLVEKIVTNGFDQPIKIWFNEKLKK